MKIKNLKNDINIKYMGNTLVNVMITKTIIEKKHNRIHSYEINKCYEDKIINDYSIRSKNKKNKKTIVPYS